MDETTAALTPEERLAKGLCAECGMDLTGQNPQSHAAVHWPLYIFPDGRNQEAIRRQKLMADYVPPTAPVTSHQGQEPHPATATATLAPKVR
jgi:hypothetical protein